MGLFTNRKIKKIIKLIEDGEIKDFEDLYKYTKSDEIRNNGNVISLLLHKEGVGYNNLPGVLKNRTWVVSELASQDKVRYSDLTEYAKNDPWIVSELVEQDKVEYKDLTEEMKKNYKFVVKLVRDGKVEYKDLSENIKLNLLKCDAALTKELFKQGNIEYKDVPSLTEFEELFRGTMEAASLGRERYEKIILNPLIEQGKVSYKDLPDEYKHYEENTYQILKNVVRYGKDEYKDLPYELRNAPGIVLKLIEAGKIRSYSVLTKRVQSSPAVVETLLAKQGKIEYNQLPDDLNLKLECMRAFAEVGKLKRKDLPKLPENPDDVQALEKETGMKLEDIKARMEECVQISEDVARISKEETKVAKQKTVETAVLKEHIEEKTKTVEVEKVAKTKVEPKKETALEKELREINEKLAELWAKKEEIEKAKASKIDDAIDR